MQKCNFIVFVFFRRPITTSYGSTGCFFFVEFEWFEQAFRLTYCFDNFNAPLNHMTCFDDSYLSVLSTYSSTNYLSSELETNTCLKL